MNKLMVAMLMVMMAAGVSACGNDAAPTKESTGQSSVEQSSEEVSDEVSLESKEETKEADELPNWKGVYDHVGDVVVGKGSFGIDIAYPSLKPASGGCAYQKDPAVVLVSTPGTDDNNEYVVIEDVADTLNASMDTISMWMQSYRGYSCSDFNFAVEQQEKVTVNDMPACKYEGMHSYVISGETKEIPFVAYSFYTGQMEGHSYFTIIVMDDSINNPTMAPLPEGTIEAYARKMVESVRLD